MPVRSIRLPDAHGLVTALRGHPIQQGGDTGLLQRRLRRAQRGDIASFRRGKILRGGLQGLQFLLQGNQAFFQSDPFGTRFDQRDIAVMGRNVPTPLER